MAQQGIDGLKKANSTFATLDPDSDPTVFVPIESENLHGAP